MTKVALLPQLGHRRRRRAFSGRQPYLHAELHPEKEPLLTLAQPVRSPASRGTAGPPPLGQHLFCSTPTSPKPVIPSSASLSPDAADIYPAGAEALSVPDRRGSCFSSRCVCLRRRFGRDLCTSQQGRPRRGQGLAMPAPGTPHSQMIGRDSATEIIVSEEIRCWMLRLRHGGYRRRFAPARTTGSERRSVGSERALESWGNERYLNDGQHVAPAQQKGVSFDALRSCSLSPAAPLCASF